METWKRVKGEKQASILPNRERVREGEREQEKIPISWDKMQFFVGITLQINFKESRFFDICRHNKKNVHIFQSAHIKTH